MERHPLADVGAGVADDGARHSWGRARCDGGRAVVGKGRGGVEWGEQMCGEAATPSEENFRR